MKIRCRLFGHDVRMLGKSGGLPHFDLFALAADCRRCGEDLSIVVPSRMTIYPREADRG